MKENSATQLKYSSATWVALSERVDKLKRAKRTYVTEGLVALEACASSSAGHLVATIQTSQRDHGLSADFETDNDAGHDDGDENDDLVHDDALRIDDEKPLDEVLFRLGSKKIKQKGLLTEEDIGIINNYESPSNESMKGVVQRMVIDLLKKDCLSIRDQTMLKELLSNVINLIDPRTVEAFKSRMTTQQFASIAEPNSEQPNGVVSRLILLCNFKISASCHLRLD
ncbi:uncharacterized protein BX664DRAFT_57125 [Halteromyces radiatus]|uniref:uncharacterized protein n=1 Tax=Halteromyces radiatus TaxID=101107 RepID=UPI002220013A|nr:uncharacterized protein BX664DRAFT_57125 [Halteromyces radiatus]KAI8096349.1 hypothetical protein BX664DRAFT_57125 [Halteromyces radiatus]